MMSFICYRREEGQYIAETIRDQLAREFGQRNVFMDVDSIPRGLDFRRVIREAVDRCDVLLVVIGPDWLSVTKETGDRRIDDPADFVRIEIEAALQRDIPIIPLLVRGAIMPPEADLPSSLQPLAYRNGLPIRPGRDLPRDIEDLVAALRDLPQTGVPDRWGQRLRELLLHRRLARLLGKYRIILIIFLVYLLAISMYLFIVVLPRLAG